MKQLIFIQDNTQETLSCNVCRKLFNDRIALTEHNNEHLMEEIMRRLSSKFKAPTYEKIESLPYGIHFYYHTTLKLVVCGACECAIVTDHVISHCHRMHSVPKNKLCVKKLEDELTSKNWTPLRTEESAKLFLSTLGNCDPIDPFPVEDGLQCSNCLKCFSSIGTFNNNHINADHSGEKLKVKVQTLFKSSVLRKYFRVNINGTNHLTF